VTHLGGAEIKTKADSFRRRVVQKMSANPTQMPFSGKNQTSFSLPFISRHDPDDDGYQWKSYGLFNFHFNDSSQLCLKPQILFACRLQANFL
jgi:hypothetical protein